MTGRTASTHTDQPLQSETCPECGGRIEHTSHRGEMTCSECGLVVESDAIDRGPEWRAFDAHERAEKSRVGAPTTETLHDKGLSTQIDWRDADANGTPLSAEKRRQMQRLRTWNKRCHTRNYTERHLRQAFGEIDRIACALGLPQSVRETASVIYRRVYAEGLLAGRSIEEVAPAAVYAAARQEQIPRTLDTMATVAQVNRTQIGRAYRAVTTELELGIEPADPRNYLPRFVSELDCSEDVHRQAYDLLSDVIGTPTTNGRCPAGLAAGALYTAATQMGDSPSPFTQQEIGDVANVTAKTVRDQYKELLDND